MSPSPKSRISRISWKSRKFNFPISLGIFKCPMASLNVPKSKILNIPNTPKVLKIEFPNILRHIQMVYVISQCPQVQKSQKSHKSWISWISQISPKSQKLNFQYPYAYSDVLWYLPMSKIPKIWISPITWPISWNILLYENHNLATLLVLLVLTLCWEWHLNV